MFISKSTGLVKSLLEYCDISSQQFEEENKVLLAIDYELNILIIVEHKLINLVGAVGTLSKSRSLYHNLLKENSKNLGHGSPRYSIDSSNDELMVSLSVDGHSMELDQFIKVVEDFIGLCEAWIRTLNAGGTDIPKIDISVDKKLSDVPLKAGDKENPSLFDRTVETHYIKP